MQDEELVRLTLEGDNEAFRQLYDRYVHNIFQYAYTQVGDYQQAEEITQDVMYKMASNLDRFKGESQFKTWLFTIGRRTVIDYFRKNKRHQQSIHLPHEQLEGFEQPGVSVEQEIMNRQSQQEIIEGLNQLPVHYRTVLHLRFVEGFSVADTARVMSRTVLSIKALQVKAKKKLADFLRNEVSNSHGS